MRFAQASGKENPGFNLFRSYLKIRIFGRDRGEAEDQLTPSVNGIFDMHTQVCRGLETRTQRRYRRKRLFLRWLLKYIPRLEDIMKKILRMTCLMLSFLVLSGLPAVAGRGISVTGDLSHNIGKLGIYRALIIGINDYEDPNIPDLKTAVNDAVAMAELLHEHYGFQVKLLLDRNATKENIYRSLRNLASSTKSNESVLIYYAGHGDLDRTFNDGWWIPADAKGGDPVTYLDNTQVQKAMRSMAARHVLLISDSCYSGTLFGQSRAMPQVIDNNYYVNLYNEKSRWGMTSGNKTPVSDFGSGDHSVFAYQLLNELRKNEKPYLSIQELCTRVAPIVSNNSEQTPMCRPIRNTGDEGGEFVFVASGNPGEISSDAGLTAERRRLEQERLELERIKMEIERKKLEDELNAVKAKTLKPEKPRSKQLAAIPTKAPSSSEKDGDNHKADKGKRHSLAVFPISEIGFPVSSSNDLKKYIDFIIKYTDNFPDIILTHSYYPYENGRTTHPIISIRDMISHKIERKIWYGNSSYAHNKPDIKMLKQLSKKINSGLVLIFKVESEGASPYSENSRYIGYLVDIDHDLSFEENYDSEQSSPFTDFAIVETLTKKLFKSYLNSNHHIDTK